MAPSVTSPSALFILSWSSLTSPATAAHCLPMRSATRASPGPHRAMARYSGDSSPILTSTSRSGRGGRKRRVRARAARRVPGVKFRTPSMKGSETPAMFATAAQVVAMGSLRKRSRMSSETSTGVKESVSHGVGAFR